MPLLHFLLLLLLFALDFLRFFLSCLCFGLHSFSFGARRFVLSQVPRGAHHHPAPRELADFLQAVGVSLTNLFVPHTVNLPAINFAAVAAHLVPNHFPVAAFVCGS